MRLRPSTGIRRVKRPPRAPPFFPAVETLPTSRTSLFRARDSSSANSRRQMGYAPGPEKCNYSECCARDSLAQPNRSWRRRPLCSLNKRNDRQDRTNRRSTPCSKSPHHRLLHVSNHGVHAVVKTFHVHASHTVKVFLGRALHGANMRDACIVYKDMNALAAKQFLKSGLHFRLVRHVARVSGGSAARGRDLLAGCGGRGLVYV